MESHKVINFIALYVAQNAKFHEDRLRSRSEAKVELNMN